MKLTFVLLLIFLSCNKNQIDTTLKDSNDQLSKENYQLERRVIALEKTISELKKNDSINTGLIERYEYIIDSTNYPFNSKRISAAKLNKWLKTYNVSIQDFKFNYKKDIKTTDGHINAVYDQKFNPVYKTYLIYSPNKKKYIDLDSESWVIENGKKEFEPDQGINIVDLNEKKIQKIAHFGSSAWIEDAYWLDNDSFSCWVMTVIKCFP